MTRRATFRRSLRAVTRIAIIPLAVAVPALGLMLLREVFHN